MISDELKKQIEGRLDSVAADTTNLSGGTTLQDEAAAQNRADAMTVGQTVKAGFYDNPIVGAVDTAKQWMIPSDPNFNIGDHADKLMSTMPQSLLYRYSGVESQAEMDYLTNDINDELQKQSMLSKLGWEGTASQLLSGVVDPIQFAALLVSGGSYLGPKAAATVAKATKSARMTSLAYGVAAGVEGNVASDLLSINTTPTRNMSELPAAIMGGVVFGTGFGALTRMDRLANKATRDFIDNADVRVYQTDTVHGYDRGEFSGINVEKSVGAATTNAAARQGSTGLDYEPSTSDLLEKAQRYLDNTDEYAAMLRATSATGVKKAVEKLDTFIDKVPFLKTDFVKLFKSSSAIARATALKLFEDAGGYIRNGTTATLLNSKYRDHIARPGMSQIDTTYKGWLKEKNLLHTELNEQTFWRSVNREMDDMYIDGVGTSTSQAVKDQAIATNESYKNGIVVQQGKQGETAVRGSENIQHFDGWRPYRWQGSAINDLIRGGVKESQIVDGLMHGYRSMHPGWTEEALLKTARSVIRRARAIEDGIDTNMTRLMDAEGVDFAIKFFTDSGIAREEAEKMVKGLKGLKADQSKIKILKHRNDIDPRTPIPGSTFTLGDMMDNNIPRTLQRYSRQAAGAAAMARHGIQKEDWPAISAAILDELKVNGKTGEITQEDLDGVMQAFSGGALGGGLNPWTRRLLTTANLGMLNTLGLTQAAETGVVIAAFGIDTFIETAPKAVKEMMHGKYSPAMEQLGEFSSAIQGEHLISRPEMMMDEWKSDPKVQAERVDWTTKLMQDVDKTLMKATRLQGYTSLFYKVRHAQHNMVGRAFLQYMGKLSKGTKSLSEARKYDMGFGTDPALFQRVMDNFRDHVEYKDGLVHDLHVEDWNVNDWHEFASIHDRVSNQLVQKAYAGEDMLWLHKDIGAVFGHLKSFTLVSLKKQLIRNMRIADPVTAGMFVYGLAMGGLVYTAKQVIGGRTERLDPLDIAKGAFGMSNMTASIPGFIDPLGSMLGIDAFKFNQYARPGAVGGKILPGVPSLDVMERMLHAPHSMFSVAMGNYDKQDITAMQAIPIIGNLYGFSYMFNSMKDGIDAEKARLRRADAKTQPVAGTAQDEQEQSGQEDISQPNQVPTGGDTAAETINKAIEVGQ